VVKVWIGTLLNFFLPGAGYLVIGHRVPLAVMWLIGVIGLTWVERGIQVAAPQYYWTMFGCVFLMNIAFAADCFLHGKAKFGGS